MTQMRYEWKKPLDQFMSNITPIVTRPVIGITGNWGDKGCELADGYYESVRKAGGVPMVIPPYEDLECLSECLDRIDALLLSGGGDINPLLWGEEPIPALRQVCPKRDRAELCLTRMAYQRQIPILGICKGIQVIVAALEGHNLQDIDQTTRERPVKHSQDMPRTHASHTVHIAKDTLLSKIIGCSQIAVNSFHHQSVQNPGKHLKVCAQATDGIIEAVESTEHRSILGVQWHPECFILEGDNCMMPLFNWLIQEASSYHKAREIHKRIITLDSHCDTPMCFNKSKDLGISPAQLFGCRTDLALVDLHKMKEGMLDASIMVAYLPQQERTDVGHKDAYQQAHTILDQIELAVEAHSDVVEIARNPQQIAHLKQQGRKAILLGIENGYAIGKQIDAIEEFRQRGVVYMTLCHNGNNEICDSAKGDTEHGGLSDFGRRAVKEMNRVGMMIDLSHAAPSTLYDVLETSQVPIVCSHSNSYALCEHARNLTDEQLRAVARHGGVVQSTFYHGFLRSQGEADILDVVAHIRHMAQIMGVEHVGIGSDFDGDGGVKGLDSASAMIQLTRHLQNYFNEEDIQRIWGGNFLRVMNEVQNFKQ